MDPRDIRLEDHGAWMSGEPLTDYERSRIAEVRALGCECLWPLLGYRPDVGTRCRLCGVEPEGY